MIPAQIELTRLEGAPSECNRPVVVQSFLDANALLATWAQTAPKMNEGYHKCSVTIGWADGTQTVGRYDLTLRDSTGADLEARFVAQVARAKELKISGGRPYSFRPSRR